jgi:hypothetical protein
VVAINGPIQLRRDTSANWTSSNPVLAAGELGWDITSNRVKIGDGTTAWNSLGPGPLVQAMIRQEATYTLSAVATAQKMFNGSTNGALTLPVGAYRFNCLANMTFMSATSGNSKFGLAGSAALAASFMFTTGADAAVTAAAAQSGMSTSAATGALAFFPASQHIAGTATVQYSYIVGCFRVTTTGTVIPQITLATAASARMITGSFFECWSVGPNSATVVSVGDWS